MATEEDYARATFRVIELLEDEKIIKDIAGSSEGIRLQKILTAIENSSLENKENLKAVVENRYNKKFTKDVMAGNVKTNWGGKSIEDLIIERKPDEIIIEARTERDVQISVELRTYESQQKTIETKYSERIKEAISARERKMIEKNKREEIIIAQRRLSGAARIKLEAEGKLIA